MPNEKRSRTNFLGGLVEDNPLTNVAVLLTSASLASLPLIDTTNHAVVILDPDGVGGAPEIVYVTAHAAAATTATILRAQEGTAARAHLRDVPWIHGSTKRDFSRDFKFARRTTGNVNIASTTTFSNVDIGLDLVLAAQIGDVIEYGISARWSNQAQEGYLDVVTIVSSSRVNYLSGITVGEATSLGAQGWMGDVSHRANVGGSILYTLVAGDLSEGTVRLRLVSKTSGSKDLIAITTAPLHVWAKNLGPQEAN